MDIWMNAHDRASVYFLILQVPIAKTCHQGSRSLCEHVIAVSLFEDCMSDEIDTVDIDTAALFPATGKSAILD